MNYKSLTKNGICYMFNIQTLADVTNQKIKLFSIMTITRNWIIYNSQFTMVATISAKESQPAPVLMKGTNRTEDLTTEHFLNGLKSTPTMGCSPSRKPSEHRTTLEPDLFLTEREIQLVKCSWDLIQEVMLETGMEIYAK